MSWLKVGIVLVPVIWEAVLISERLFRGFSGGEKEDKAVDLAGTMLELVEKAQGKDLLENKDVQTAVRDVMRAIVALQNVIAKLR